MPLPELTTRKELPSVLLYGPPGSGKTSFAVGAPKPYYLDIEGSLGPMASTVPNIRPKNFPEVMSILTALVQEQHDFGSVVIDTLDHLVPLIDQHICETENVDDVRRLDKRDGFGSSGKAEAKQMLRVFAAADALSKKGIWTVLLAHSAVKTNDNPAGDSFAEVAPKMNKPVNAVAIERARIVMYTSRRIVLKDADDGDRKVVAPTDDTCYLTTRPTGPVMAKNQYNLPNGTMRTEWASFFTAFSAYKP